MPALPNVSPGAELVYFSLKHLLHPMRFAESTPEGFVLEIDRTTKIVVPLSEADRIKVVEGIGWEQKLRSHALSIVVELYQGDLIPYSEITNWLNHIHESRFKSELERAQWRKESQGTLAELREKVLHELKVTTDRVLAEAFVSSVEIETKKESHTLLWPQKHPVAGGFAEDSKGVARIPAWINRFVLSTINDDRLPLRERQWAIITARRNGFLNDSEIGLDMSRLYREEAFSIRNIEMEQKGAARRKEANSLAKRFHQELATSPSLDEPILTACLSLGDGNLTEFVDLADWAWQELDKRPSFVAADVLTVSRRDAPYWSAKKFFGLLMDGSSAPLGTAQADIGTTLVRLIESDKQRDAPFVQVLWEVLSDMERRDIQSGVRGVVCLLKRKIMSPEVAVRIGSGIAPYPELRRGVLDALRSDDNANTDVLFKTLLTVEDDAAVWLALGITSDVSPRKRAYIVADILKRTQPDQWRRDVIGIGLAALIDRPKVQAGVDIEALSIAKGDFLQDVWRTLLTNAPLKSLSDCLLMLHEEAVAPMRNENERIRAEAQVFRQEVKRLSSAAHGVENSGSVDVGWAKDLIALVDDLDSQQDQARPALVARLTKMLLATLGRHNVFATAREPGETISRSEWQAAPSEYKVFEDTANSESLTVVQRGYVLLDEAGRREVLRPALLDQPFT